ncbi:hypothetical protein TcCL_ESM04856 [Trypanosoma cruzi]|nr:hypothetical protein TcCL_ESM04856 [Trypanosoma cruzi]
MKYASPSIHGNNTAAAACPCPLLLLLAAAAAVATLYWVDAWMPLHDEATAVESCVARTQQWLQERKAYINWHFPLSIYIYMLCLSVYFLPGICCIHSFPFVLVVNVAAQRVFLMGFGITICLTFSEGYCGVFVCVCEGSVWF